MNLSIRIATIIHLCLAFGALVWIICYPFSGELFEIKSRQMLYKQLLSEKHAERFESLSEQLKNKLITENDHLSEAAQRPFLDKVRDAIRILLLVPSPFERAWIFFSILIGILILRQNEGSSYASILLPIIVFCFTVENIYYGVQPKNPLSQPLIPSESYLVKTYLSEPLGASTLIQYEQLKSAWEKYLIVEWAKQEISFDPAIRIEQKSQGEFAFVLAQVLSLSPYQKESLELPFRMKIDPLILGFYLIWNVLFAWIVVRITRGKDRKLSPSQ